MAELIDSLSTLLRLCLDWLHNTVHTFKCFLLITPHNRVFNLMKKTAVNPVKVFHRITVRSGLIQKS